MKKRILIVEDDSVSLFVATMLFEGANCEITSAMSGEIALQLFAENLINETPYNAIYMDLGLPNMNGIDTCKAIRSYETELSVSPILIIAVTANVDLDIIDKCITAGMQEVMLKPLTNEKVTRFLEQC